MRKIITLLAFLISLNCAYGEETSHLYEKIRFFPYYPERSSDKESQNPYSESIFTGGPQLAEYYKHKATTRNRPYLEHWKTYLQLNIQLADALGSNAASGLREEQLTIYERARFIQAHPQLFDFAFALQPSVPIEVAREKDLLAYSEQVHHFYATHSTSDYRLFWQVILSGPSLPPVNYKWLLFVSFSECLKDLEGGNFSAVSLFISRWAKATETTDLHFMSLEGEGLSSPKEDGDTLFNQSRIIPTKEDLVLPILQQLVLYPNLETLEIILHMEKIFDHKVLASNLPNQYARNSLNEIFIEQVKASDLKAEWLTHLSTPLDGEQETLRQQIIKEIAK